MVREYTCVISIILNALSFLFMAQDMVYLHICPVGTCKKCALCCWVMLLLPSGLKSQLPDQLALRVPL